MMIVSYSLSLFTRSLSLSLPVLLLGFELSSITIREDIRQFPVRLRSSIPVSGNGLRIRLVANDGTATGK